MKIDAEVRLLAEMEEATGGFRFEADLVVEAASAAERSVMLVDDEEDLRDVLRLHCELLGFHVVAEAADGDEAIALAEQHQPAFVILDENMPRVTGAQAAPQLRMAAPHAHIVAFSAYLDRKPDWADDFLNKLSISELTPLLGRLLDAPPR